MTDRRSSGSDGGGDRALTSVRPLHRPLLRCERCSRPTRTGITSSVPSLLILTFCEVCSSYLQLPDIRVRAAPNSKELLEHCIRLICRRVPRTIRLLNAEFVESSDRDRLMVMLHLGGEIPDCYHRTEFMVDRIICKSCCEKPARVELRQSYIHLPNTFSFLEEAMSAHGVTCRALMVQEHALGKDYWFSDRTHALDLVQFIEGIVPVKKQSDDDGVFSLDIPPIRRDDLIPSSTVGVGDSFVICTGVAANGISLMDPFTLQAAFLTAEAYWRAPCPVVKFVRDLLAEYLVLDIVTITTDPPVADDDSYCLADAHVVRVSDLGKTDDRNKLLVRTHLGRLLKPGDRVLGYDIGSASILVKKGCQRMKKESVAEPSSQEPRSVDTVLDSTRKDEELLTNSYPHQISKESQMLPTPSDDVPSNPEGKWLGDEAAAGNTTMEWLPSTHLSSPHLSSSNRT